jgi:hypothetical protein
MKTITNPSVFLLSVLLTPFIQVPLLAQGTAFTYQGRLNGGGSPANGVYDLRFSIFDSASGGTLIAGPVTNATIGVSNGLFTTALDFGAGVFNGSGRWLEIGARTNGSAAAYATVSPRQQVTATPYAIFAGIASTVTNGAITSAQLGSGSVGNAQIQANAINAAQIASGQIVKSVNGLTDNVTLTQGANITITPSGNTLQFSAANTGGWGLTGNAGTSPSVNYLGTSDNQALEAHVNGTRALRLEPTSNNSANTNLVNVIEGSPANFVTAGMRGATIGGGGAVYYFGQLCTNSVTGDFGTVAGGQANTAAAESAVGGGQQNSASGVYAAIGGGQANVASGANSFIGGGVDNFTKLSYSTVGGGAFNSCNNNFGVVGGGDLNFIAQDSEGAAILGGEHNTVWTNSINSFIGGGVSNQIIGSYSVIPGGLYNQVVGNYSFAAGWLARSTASGTFTWADPGTGQTHSGAASNSFNVFSSNSLDLEGGSSVYLAGGSTAIQMSSSFGIHLIGPNNQIQMQPSGEVDIFSQTHPTGAGVYIAAGGSGWNSLSDRNVKEHFTDINARDVLEKVAQMPISTWNYKSQKQSIRHMGPMAQDFNAAFHIGEDDKHINNLDEEGVALAAIQGLNQKLDEKEAEIADLKKSVADLKAIVDKLAEPRHGGK